MRAGSGASNNLIRSLQVGDPSITVVGCHDDPFYLRKSGAGRNYLLPRITAQSFVASLRRLAHRERLRMIIPTTDVDVHAISKHRRSLRGLCFLPRHSTVERCQDKYSLIHTLARHDVPVPITRSVRSLAEIASIFRMFRTHSVVWCRARFGTGSVGATSVRTVGQARAWINYWEDMRGVPARHFILSEYLPGRDFACQSLWQRGRLILIKTTERISYFRGESGPSGVSSIGAVHKTVRDDRLVDVAERAVRAVDPRASGAFSVDLKEDRHGNPCVTEINVGRLLTGTPIFDLTGKHNMAVTYVRLALSEATGITESHDAVDDYYMIRDLDALPDIVHRTALTAKIVDLRTPSAERLEAKAIRRGG